MYTDPGILGLIIAGLIGGVIAIPTYIIIFRKKIGDWIRGRRKNKTDE